VLRPDKEGAQNQRLETFWQASFVKKGRRFLAADDPWPQTLEIGEFQIILAVSGGIER